MKKRRKKGGRIAASLLVMALLALAVAFGKGWISLPEQEPPAQEQPGEELPALPVLTGIERAESYGFDLSKVPPYEGQPQVEVNGNQPFFTEEEITGEAFETYYPLDRLGRCTGAVACVGEELMPTGPRERLTEVKPTGWQYTKYEGIDGNYLYNRCHLIAYGLTAENLNWENLITGTRYMNPLGMNDYENDTIAYIRRTGRHVMYRATPIFEGDNLIASGILLEARSVEEDDFVFCIYAYNVQPGITIDYLTGDSSGVPYTGTRQGNTPPEETRKHQLEPETGVFTEFVPPDEDVTYVINAKTGKFHLPTCSSVQEMNQKNRWDYTGSRESLIEDGYVPCGACHP